MALPDWPYFSGEIAFKTNPNVATPWFWNVTPWLLEYSTSRGRPDEFSKADAAAPNLVLDTSRRHFDPFNTASIFYPYVIPMRRLQVQSIYPTNILRPVDNSSFQKGDVSGWTIYYTAVGLPPVYPGAIGVTGGALEVARPNTVAATTMLVVSDWIPVSSPEYSKGGELLSFAVSLSNVGAQAGTQTTVQVNCYDAKKAYISTLDLNDRQKDGVTMAPATGPFDLPTAAGYHRYSGWIATPANCAYVKLVIKPWAQTAAARDIKVDDVSVRPGIGNSDYIAGVLKNRIVGLAAPSGWPQTWNLRTAEVQVDVADFYQLVNNRKVYKYFAPSSAGSRINRLLDEAGVQSGSGARSIYSGDAFGGLQAETLDGEEAGPHIQEAADSDMGIFFFDRDGRARFDSRSVRRSKVSVATFSDTPGVGEAVALTMLPNTSPLYNDISITPVTGDTPKVPVNTAAVKASQLKHLISGIERTPLIAHGNEAQGQCDYLFWRYGQAGNRIVEITVDPTRKNSAQVSGWTYVLPRDVADCISVRKENVPGGGAPIALDSIIEGLDESCSLRESAKSFRQTYRLSPVVSQPWAALGIVGSSELNTTFVLGL